MAYRLIAFLVGLTADLFYRRVTVGAAVPDDGPVLLVANHPNALADPAVLLRVTRRRIRSLAKEPLFRMPVISWLVRGAGAIPVFRAKDGFDTSKNQEVFRAVVDALATGEVVALFPEGISHHEPGLQPLKTGAARMALDAVARGGTAAAVRVVPVGLTYRDKPAFRSDVLVHVGEPIEVAAFARDLDDDGARVRALTDAIAAQLRALTVDLERWTDAPLVELAALVWSGGARDPLAPVVAARAARALKAVEPALLDELRGALAQLGSALDREGLDASHLAIRPALGVVVTYLVRHALAVVVGTPVAVIGALAYAPPFLLLRVLPGLLRVAPDTVATVRILGGLFLFPPWHVVVVVALFLRFSPSTALFASVALPFFGLYAHAFFRRRRRMWRDGLAFARLLARPALRRRLLDDQARVRRALTRALDVTVGERASAEAQPASS